MPNLSQLENSNLIKDGAFWFEFFKVNGFYTLGFLREAS